MKAILINPHNQSITESSYNGDITQIYERIDCRTFACIDLDKGNPVNSIYIDDEGLLHNDTKRFFSIKAKESIYLEDCPLAGKGLVLGLDINNGNTVSTTLTVQDIKKMIRFEKSNFDEPKPVWTVIPLP